MSADTPGWLTGIIHKRPETGLIVHALLLHAVRTGHVTAEQAHDIRVTHPNVRGAAMKVLGKCGLAKDPIPVKGTTTQSHGHWLHKWVVVDRAQAEFVLDKLQRNVLGFAAQTNTGRQRDFWTA